MTPRPPCPRAAEVEAAFDQRLDASAQALAEEHARACLECRTTRRSLEALRATARALPPPSLEPHVSQAIRANLVASEARGSTRALGALSLAAAALTLVVGVSFRLLPDVGRRPARGGAPAEVALSGAGTLRPEPGASYRVLRAGADTRIALREGGIELAVVHRRQGERFVVALSDAEVEVRGTRFRVRAHRGALQSVTVWEGLVAVQHPGRAPRLLPAGTTWEAASASRAAAEPEALPTEGPAPEPPSPTGTTAEPSPSPRGTPTRGETPRGAQPSPASRAFREGALAYVRGDAGNAARSLQSFLAATPQSDPRREDARYVLVLALDATRDPAREREAEAYLREFPRGVRRAEVSVRLVGWLARRGACDAAARVALGLPERVEAPLRAQAERALTRCGSPEGR